MNYNDMMVSIPPFSVLDGALAVAATVAGAFALSLVYIAGKTIDRAIATNNDLKGGDGIVQSLFLLLSGGLYTWAAHLLQYNSEGAGFVVWAGFLVLMASILFAAFISFVLRASRS